MRKLLFALAVAAAIVCSFSTSETRSLAQVPPIKESIGIYQNGVLVGELYRIDPSSDSYVEHWVLFPRYVYPSPANRIETRLVPGHARYDDADDFFKRVPFEAGSRYVKVDCADGTRLPGR